MGTNSTGCTEWERDFDPKTEQPPTKDSSMPTLTGDIHRIFVFGSNLKGRHGKGAALHAAKYYGAKEGIGYGPQGITQQHSYAIPTKGYSLEVLPLSVIRRHVGYFIDYVLYEMNRNDGRTIKEFNVTQIGCGYAGYKPHEIAPMFLTLAQDSDTPVWFDEAWREYLPKARFWKGPI